MSDTHDLEAEVERLREENERLKQKKAPPGITFKVSAKGAVSAYGINSRMPVTMYANQWQRLLDKADELRKFIDDNTSQLSSKPAKQ